MVPAIVQHCIKEIEARGINDQGIYRVPGSEKDVRALKVKTANNEKIVPSISKHTGLWEIIFRHTLIVGF